MMATNDNPPLRRLARTFLACFVLAILASVSPAAETVVHLRTYAWEPYLSRAAELPAARIPFTSVWTHGKYYPDSEDRDAANPDATGQGKLAKQQMDLAREKIGVAASGGYVLHPTDWLSTEHWQRRADSLEAFIEASGTSGTIALDIEGYGKPTSNGLLRIGPPGEADFQKLISATVPIRYVLLKHKLRATIYPAAGKRFEDYTRAALALGATKFGDEYTFVVSDQLRKQQPLTASQRDTWLSYVRDTDPTGMGIYRIPGTYTSVIDDSRDRAILGFLGIPEVWLFVDRKDFLEGK